MFSKEARKTHEGKAATAGGRRREQERQKGAERPQKLAGVCQEEGRREGVF